MDLSFYLKTVFPGKRKPEENKEDVMDVALKAFLTDFNIRNKNGEVFMFNREDVSRLFNGKINLPLKLIKVLTSSSYDKAKYANDFYNKISEYNCTSDPYDIVVSLLNNLNQDPSFSPEFKAKVEESINAKDYSLFLWDLFVECARRPNKAITKSKGKVGRPKYSLPKSFYHFSKQDLKKELPKAISRFKSKKFKATDGDLQSLTDMISNCGKMIENEDALAICRNAMREDLILEKFKTIESIFDQLSMFEHGSEEEKQRFRVWRTYLEQALAETILNSLAKANTKGKRNRNYSDEASVWDWIESDAKLKAFLSSDESFLNEMARQSFFLPSFLESIGREAWHCCLEAAKFAGHSKKAKVFSEVVSNFAKDKDDAYEKANYLINLSFTEEKRANLNWK